MGILVFSRSFFERLQHFLFSNVPKENGCFLLANSFRKISGESVLVVTEMIDSSASSWKTDGEHALEPTSSYINASAVRADSTDSSLIFVHTHPSGFHPPTFSPIDERSNSKIFQNLS